MAGEKAARAILANQTPTRIRGSIGSQDAFGATALRPGRSFGGRLDFERRRCPTAKLPGEKIEILLDPAQKRVQVRLVADIGGIAGRERGAVKGEAEDAMTPTQQRVRQPALLIEGDAFRRQRDAVDEAEPGEDARHMQRFEALVHRQLLSYGPGLGEQPGVADGERDLEQSRSLGAWLSSRSSFSSIDELRTVLRSACLTFVQQSIRVVIRGEVEYLEGGPTDQPLDCFGRDIRVSEDMQRSLDTVGRIGCHVYTQCTLYTTRCIGGQIGQRLLLEQVE